MRPRPVTAPSRSARLAMGAFVAVMLALSALPAIQMATRAVPEFAVDEQRRLAPPPSLAEPVALPRAANAWFADHFGLRSLLIRLKAQVDWSVFGMSDRVYVGRDGYLFYRHALDIEKPRIEAGLATEAPAAIDGMRRFTAALRDAGVDTVLTVNLLGDRFMPERVPAAATPVPPRPRIDAFVDALRALPNLTFVDSTAILRRTATERAIFHRTDFHWNDPAAFPVAQAVIEAVSRHEGRASPWRHALEIEARPFSGGVARFMPIFLPPTETGLFVRQNFGFPPGTRVSTTEAPLEFVTRSPPETEGLLRPVLFVGDSFLDGMMRSGLDTFFVTTSRLRWAPGMTVPDIARALPADARHLVIQFIEVGWMSVEPFADRGAVDRAVEIIRARPRP